MYLLDFNNNKSEINENVYPKVKEKIDILK